MALYKIAIDQLVPVSSTQAAEMTKLLENIHRSVNIGLVNEMKIVADKMGIDIFEVIDAAATKPLGLRLFIQVQVLVDTAFRSILLSHMESQRVRSQYPLYRTRG